MKLEKKKVISGMFVVIILLVSVFGALWYFDKHNIKPRVIDLYGDTYYDIGLMYGSKIKSLVNGIDTCVSYLENIVKSLTDLNITKYIEGYLDYIPDYIKEIMNGTSVSSGLAFDRILLLNSIGEIFHHIYLSLYSCSQFAVINNSFPEVGPIFGRTMDYQFNELFENWQVVLRVKPPTDKDNSVIGIGIAGMVGLQNGMNDKGLCMGVTQVSSTELGYGTPSPITIFDTLIKNSNTYEAEQYIKNGTYMKHASAWTYLLLDKNEVSAIVEVTNKNNFTRWHQEEGNDYIVSTNHFVSVNMTSHGTHRNDLSSDSGSVLRKKVLEEELLIKVNYDLEDAIKTLRSHYDISISGDPGQPYHNCVCNNDDFGSMHGFIGVPMHNYTLISLVNPAEGSFYLITFSEIIGPVA
ncbi:MAG: hypothetical protein GF329_18610 [Candidatus Lokiarchaeota archaeon]|nr:hypothetical protein [Candidatus Lokiarchaeota archaeon]